MYEKVIKQELLGKLALGTIQPFQIEEMLRMKCLPDFEVQQLKSEIIADWERNI